MKYQFERKIKLLLFCMVILNFAGHAQLPQKAEILETLIRVNGYWMNSHLDPGDYEWNRAAYFTGNMGLYQIYPDQVYLDYALKWANLNSWGLKEGPSTRHADNQCIGQTYLDLYNIEKDPERIADIQYSIEQMVNSEKKDDWWWIDAFYMAMPVFTRLGVLNNDTAYFKKMYDLYAGTRTLIHPFKLPMARIVTGREEMAGYWVLTSGFCSIYLKMILIVWNISRLSKPWPQH